MPISLAHLEKSWQTLRKHFDYGDRWVTFSKRISTEPLECCLAYPRKKCSDNTHCGSEYQPTIDGDTAIVLVNNLYPSTVAVQIDMNASGLKAAWQVKRNGAHFTRSEVRYAEPSRRRQQKLALLEHTVIVAPTDPAIDKETDTVLLSAIVAYDFDAPQFPSIKGNGAPWKLPQLEVTAD